MMETVFERNKNFTACRLIWILAGLSGLSLKDPLGMKAFSLQDIASGSFVVGRY
jgi:hypothetical protein